MTMQTIPHADLAAIMDKIARLKNLAANPGTPEEAAAAVAAIDRLMIRYNLSEMQVAAAARNDAAGYEKVHLPVPGASWQIDLISVLAETSFCKVIGTWGRGNGVHIIGERHNIIAATGMHEFLVAEIDRLAEAGWRALDPWVRSSTTARKWKYQFRIGASIAVQKRLRAQHRESLRAQQAEDAQTSALVLVKDEALANAVAEFFPSGLTSSRRTMRIGGAGYAAGQAAGRGINLAHQIGS